MKVLVTGSSGLIGSAAVRHYDSVGADVTGLDNNMRQEFFGPMGSTQWNLERLLKETKRFTHQSVDIRSRDHVFELVKTIAPDMVIHCAAQRYEGVLSIFIFNRIHKVSVKLPDSKGASALHFACVNMLIQNV